MRVLLTVAAIALAAPAYSDVRSECVRALALHENQASQVEALMYLLALHPVGIEPQGNRPVAESFGDHIAVVVDLLNEQREALSDLCRDKL